MKRTIIGLISFTVGCLAMASTPDNPDTVAPGAISSYMTPGKATVISQDKLPAAMQKVARANIAQRRAGSGYEPVPEDVFTYGLSYQSRILRDGNSAHNIKVKLAELDGSALARCRYDGFLPNGPTLNGPWTSVVRVFTCSNQIVMLSEWDYVADGGGITIVKEAMNTTVGKFPAQLSRKRSPSGKVMTELAWATDNKYFTLTVWADVPRGQRPEQSDGNADMDHAVTEGTMIRIANQLS